MSKRWPSGFIRVLPHAGRVFWVAHSLLPPCWMVLVPWLFCAVLASSPSSSAPPPWIPFSSLSLVISWSFLRMRLWVTPCGKPWLMTPQQSRGVVSPTAGSCRSPVLLPVLVGTHSVNNCLCGSLSLQFSAVFYVLLQLCYPHILAWCVGGNLQIVV